MTKREWESQPADEGEGLSFREQRAAKTRLRLEGKGRGGQQSGRGKARGGRIADMGMSQEDLAKIRARVEGSGDTSTPTDKASEAEGEQVLPPLPEVPRRRRGRRNRR